MDYLHKTHFFLKERLNSHLCFTSCFSSPPSYRRWLLSCCVQLLLLFSIISRQADLPGVISHILLIPVFALAAMSCRLPGDFWGTKKWSCCLSVSQPHLTSRMWALGTQGLMIWSQAQTKSQYQCWVRKVKRWRMGMEHDTERGSLSFSLSPGLRWAWSWQNVAEKRTCQTIINSETMQMKLMRISGPAKPPNSALSEVPVPFLSSLRVSTVWKGLYALLYKMNTLTFLSLLPYVCLSHVLIALMASLLLLALFVWLFVVCVCDSSLCPVADFYCVYFLI